MDARKTLEDFIVDNPDLERLEDMLAEFNVFEVLGIERNEPRHSAFLAWLLDPNGTHGLGDYFLRRFLWRVTSYARTHHVATVTAFDVDQWRLRDVIVETERHRIDILLTSQEDRFMCAIENKVFSGEHGNQLERYRQIVERDYKALTPLYVFLTVEGEPPANKKDARCYVPMSYSQIADLTEQAVAARSSSLGVNVQGALQQYVTTLRRHILVDSDIQQLARQIYYKHRAAIDLIIDARPDITLEVRDIIQLVMKDFPRLQMDSSMKQNIRYYPPEWDQIPELRQGQRWTESRRMLLFEFRNWKPLNLDLVLGPGLDTIRKRVINLTQQKPFVAPRRPNKPPEWAWLYRKPILSRQDYDESEFAKKKDEIKDKISKAVSQFMDHDFERLVRAVQQEFC